MKRIVLSVVRSEFLQVMLAAFAVSLLIGLTFIYWLPELFTSFYFRA